MIIENKTIRWKLFIYYFLLLAIFSLSVLVYQNHREKQFRIAQLENRLNEYTDLTSRMMIQEKILDSGEFHRLDSVNNLLFPDNVRVTIFDIDGNVLYDNSVHDYQHMENHRGRPEFQKALYGESGYNIRHSATTNEDYFYYAKSYRNVIVRSAVVYNIDVKNFLKIDHIFIIYLFLLFIVFGVLLRLIANRLGDSITKLKDFAVKVRHGEAINEPFDFSNDELGIISKEITTLFEESRKAKADLVQEKEKLISHLFVLKEGVAFFSSEKKAILNNSHFIFYINTISEESSISVEKIFFLEEFSEINAFIEKSITSNTLYLPHELPRMEASIQRDGFHFLVQCIIFQDKSFEILITDNTQLVKRSTMKQQITSNIAHELKTPIASVKGYLETVLNNPDLDKRKQHYFVEKAYNQSERLTQLVNDIALLNKIEESSELYAREKIGVKKLVDEVVESFSDAIRNKNIQVEVSVNQSITVNANYSLIFSVFRNLMENSLNYGGDGIAINISNYHEDSTFQYFSFSDSGPGVEEEHLNRIFERFYRVDSGRSRKQGGTGLGLAIVKNAVVSFKGEISARKRKGGGLEFLFSLPK